MFRAARIAALMLPGAAFAAGDPELSLPLDCTLGETCFVQNYVDRDPGPGASDYGCGGLTYDGHKGTDIRVPTMADMRRGVNVLAPAPGVVQGLRDGIADVGPTDKTTGQECGNGVVIRHANGWETQVCHMKSGSVEVKLGQIVERGDILGQVGLSGQTEFPHVHLSVRRDGQMIDPFNLAAFASCGEGAASLWQSVPDYAPGGLLEAGFSPGLPTYEEIKEGRAARSQLAADAGGLVLFGFGFGGRTGDVVELRIAGPGGLVITQSATLDKDQAQFFRAGGKRLTKARWPAGRYDGTVTLLRGDREVDRSSTSMIID